MATSSNANINLINAKSLSSSKVNLVFNAEGCDQVKVSLVVGAVIARATS